MTSSSADTQKQTCLTEMVAVMVFHGGEARVVVALARRAKLAGQLGGSHLRSHN